MRYFLRKSTKWVKVSKNGSSKICGWQSLKILKWYGHLGSFRETISLQTFLRLCSTNFAWFILEYLDQNDPPLQVWVRWHDCILLQATILIKCWDLNYSNFLKNTLKCVVKFMLTRLRNLKVDILISISLTLTFWTLIFF